MCKSAERVSFGSGGVAVSQALVDRAQSDEALMARAQADDTDAFALLYDRHAERALRITRAICRDPGRAEDAVQEGFLAIWRHRGNYEASIGGFRAWSMQIVKNRAIDFIRSTSTRPLFETGVRPEVGTKFHHPTGHRDRSP